ncbi:MAG TPA: methylmalonyl-CoA epimerase [Planctomycetota bacterium]|nr:methylmalonyl-CoA epimerase [Planctomycetota bacterium]
MMKLDHIGIAIKKIETALPFYQQGLGLEVHIEEVPAMKIRTAKLPTANMIIELVEPLSGEEAVSKFIEKRGEGIHHLCFAVENIRDTMKQLQAKGYKPIYPEPKVGAGGHLVNFLSPKDTSGVLIEIAELS